MQKQKQAKIYRCKHGKVQVVSKNNFHPVLGKQHSKHCPRARNLN